MGRRCHRFHLWNDTMSTQDLTYHLPRIASRPLRRRLRTTKRKLLQTYRRQYFLTSAFRDLRSAVARNEDIFIASIIIAAVVGYSFATTATDLLLLFFKTAFDATNAIGIGMLPLSITALGTMAVLCIWVLAFMLNTLSLAIMDGANGKLHRSLRRTVRNGLRSAGRVSSTWFMLSLRALIPIAAVGIMSIVYIAAAGMSLEEAIALAPIAGTAAGLGVLYTLLQYSLAPYVALFEQELTVGQTFRRSRQLIKRRGRLFLLSLYVATAAVLAGIYGLALLLESVLGLDKLVLGMLGTFAAGLSLNCMLTTLYRKRKLARKH